jgi:hypothetical protein
VNLSSVKYRTLKLPDVVLKPEGPARCVDVISERRHHKRFDTVCIPGSLSVVGEGQSGLTLHDGVLINLSYGGVCFRTSLPLAKNDIVRCLLDLKDPFNELVFVKARVLWTKRDEHAESLSGAVFLESSKGWFGPEDDDNLSAE